MMIALGVTCPLNENINSSGSRRNTAISIFRHNHLPPRLLNQCLRDIFSYLLNWTSVVILLEYAHFADYLTWTVLVELVGIPSLALVVLTMEPLEDLTVGPNYSLPSMLSKKAFSYTTASVEFKRLIVVHKKLLNFKSTILVKLIDYSIPDVEQLLCSVLSVSRCPEGTANMVHQLSGGNPFWCREMALFIQITGAEEFMRAMNPAKAFFSLSGSSECKQMRKTNKMYKYFAQKSLAFSPSLSFSDGVDVNRSQSIDFVTVVSKQKPLTSEEGERKCYKKMRMPNSIHPVATHALLQEHGLNVRSDSDDHHFNPLYRANKSTTSKLELFIVCRFEKLSSEDQNVLRTASIIGNNFSRDVLYGILSPTLRTQMDTSLSSLKKNQWVTDSKTNSNPEHSINTEYSFVHPLLYQTLYDLSPASEKARLHYVVASYIEDTCEGSPIHFAQLGHQYSLASDCKPKAFEYFVRAAVYCFSQGPHYYNEALCRLKHATQFGHNSVDFEAILGIVMDKKDMLTYSRQQLLRDEKNAILIRPAEQRITFTSIISKVWAFFSKIPRQTERRKDMTFNAGYLTIGGTDIFIGLLCSMEDLLQGLMESAVKRGREAEPSNWQLPYLAMREELVKKEEQRRNMDIMRRRSKRSSLNQNGDRKRLAMLARKFSWSAASNERGSVNRGREGPSVSISSCHLSS